MPSVKKFLTITGAAGFFIAIFPWVFSYRGTIAGHHLSIRALGDELAVALALFGMAVLASARLRQKLVDWGAALDSFPEKIQGRLLWGAVGIYLLAMISHKLRAHYVGHTHAFDLGSFSNVCWNTLQGDWFYSSLFERNFMGVHVNWILWPLAYGYYIYRGAEVLLVAQAVFIAAAVPVLWRTTQAIIGSFSAGALAAMLFVCSPFIGHTVLNDFHPDVWLVPCLFLALAAWLKNQPARVVLFSLLAILAKEDVSVVVCGFGLFLLCHKNWRWVGAGLFAASLAIFLFHTMVFIPRYLTGATSILFDRYHFLGGSFGEMASNLLFEPSVYIRAWFHEPTKFWRFLCYFLPAAGMTFLAPLYLIPPIISVLPHLLSQAATQLSLAEIYSLPSQPFIFVGAAVGAGRLLQKLESRRIPFLVGGLFIVAGLGIYSTPRAYRSEPQKRIHALHEMKKLVPPEASVAAQEDLYPHFDARRYIHLFPHEMIGTPLQTRYLANPDYIAADRIGNALPWNEIYLAKVIARVEKDPAYIKIYEKENFLLFKRIESGPPEWKTENPPIN